MPAFRLFHQKRSIRVYDGRIEISRAPHSVEVVDDGSDLRKNQQLAHRYSTPAAHHGQPCDHATRQ
jgi:hypothetical protein